MAVLWSGPEGLVVGQGVARGTAVVWEAESVTLGFSVVASGALVMGLPILPEAVIAMSAQLTKFS